VLLAALLAGLCTAMSLQAVAAGWPDPPRVTRQAAAVPPATTPAPRAAFPSHAAVRAMITSALTTAIASSARPPTATGGLSPDQARVAARQAAQQARTAAAKVDALLDRYARASQQVADGVQQLSHAFATASRAQSAHQLSAAQQASSEALQRRQVRAVYVAGGSSGLISSVLAASSPDDALWRMSTASRVLDAVLDRTESQVEQDADAAALTRIRARQADAAAEEHAAALSALQARAAHAERALSLAQVTLSALTTRARQARAATIAAERIAAARTAAQFASRTAAGTATAVAIPPEFWAAYHAAAPTCPGMSWTLLAAVGQVESGHGRNNGPSSAGAIGPMQFMPATFADVGVDGDHDGTRDAWDPQDAVFSAARYLCRSGAEGGTADGIQRALLAYNHAQWYVDLVLSVERAIIAVQA
jgi:Transglycosylase SLT domain